MLSADRVRVDPGAAGTAAGRAGAVSVAVGREAVTGTESAGSRAQPKARRTRNDGASRLSATLLVRDPSVTFRPGLPGPGEVNGFDSRAWHLRGDRRTQDATRRRRVVTPSTRVGLGYVFLRREPGATCRRPSLRRRDRAALLSPARRVATAPRPGRSLMPASPSLHFSLSFYCNAVSARICCTLLGRPSSAYFEYACGDLGRKALQLQTSTAFRDEAGEKCRLVWGGGIALAGDDDDR